MTQPLHALFQGIASARDERELRLRFMDTVGEAFDAQRWGIYLLDNQFRLAGVDVRGVSDVFVERYEQVGRSVDPVMRYVVEHHAPAHEQLMLTAEGWKQSELYQSCCSRYDHEHIMTGPIVGGGCLVGTVHFARVSGTPAFDAEDIANLSAVCAHLSASLAMLRTQPTRFNSLLANRLTQREVQIALLVAQGLTNAEIGAELWITQNSVKQALKRMFRKLDVSSRTEMVAQLQGVLGS
ncbi:LuxR family transcriptional regulator [Trichocoleus sp. FACHB-90]|uniref:LuxR C-terminal-related transcriptional regulator n=1 Tax=Cyanophyceae TaxID=3028117 RepID=UPI001687EF58|nr:LuxR C-terminal-related transcriptional regulator [Trichocoleus sp. FACHB-90]MBD1925435.1 LuxR family transcriptional regulator [Trichocoleus sp. FACHB-90]